MRTTARSLLRRAGLPVRAEIERTGFVVDFGELSPLRDHLRQNLDRRLLNDVMTAAPTSENIALKLFDWCHEHLALPDGATVDAIRVSETPSTWAEYRPEPETTTPAVFG